MNTEQIKSRLSRIARIDEMMMNNLQEIEKWRTNCECPGTSSWGTERVQSSGKGQKVEAALNQYLSVKQKKTAENEKLQEEKDSIIKDIEKLPINDWYNVIYKRYVLTMNFNQIASEMERSYSWCTWIHNKALEYLQRLLF